MEIPTLMMFIFLGIGIYEAIELILYNFKCGGIL